MAGSVGGRIGIRKDALDLCAFANDLEADWRWGEGLRCDVIGRSEFNTMQFTSPILIIIAIINIISRVTINAIILVNPY